MSPPKVTGAAPTTPRADTAPAVPDHAIDSSIDVKSDEFKNLPATYKKAVTDAKAYAARFDGMSPPPKVMVTPSSQGTNGGQPVTVVVPPGAGQGGNVDVQTHYHGDGAHSTSGTNGAAEEIAKKIKAGDQTVYVLPEANGTDSKGRTNWTNAKNIGATTAEALKSAGVTGNVSLSISAHSAGGRALATALNNGEQLKAKELSIQDAVFDGAWSTLKGKLAGQSAGVQHITIVSSKERGLGPRGDELKKDLVKAGRSVDIAPQTEKHDEASRVFEMPAQIIPEQHKDGFEQPARR